MTNNIQNEERIAHLTHTIDELSDVLGRQQIEIDRLTRRVEMLMQRAAEQEQDAGGSVALGDQPPPHY